jgi:NitT/TauT family transport system substrate-binding protein/putative hydroxymethylpyrimidine transport system substrate-binding protein
VTIGFTAVPSLAAGKVAATTGFWNAEAVALRRQGVPIRVFKVDDFGAPPYPELVLTTSEKLLKSDPELVDAVVSASRRGYAFAEKQPEAAVDDLLADNKNLERADQEAQMKVLLPAMEPRPFDKQVLEEWAAWDLKHHLLEKQLDVGGAFRDG